MELNSYIDHTILKAEATTDMIEQLCQEARENQFASVCVNSCFTEVVVKLLKGSNVKTCVVIGFPLGAMHPVAKKAEAELVCRLGAQEIDMVINIGALKEGKTLFVQSDIEGVVQAAHTKAALVKVIIETCLLSDEEKILACQLSVAAGADFVKTSTGFSTAGAKLEDIRLMKEVVGTDTKIKASGGIKNREQAIQFIEAGADRLGTSNGLAIIQNIEASTTY